MPESPEPMIQVAGVIDLAEAQMLCDAGVNYLGFPLRLKDGREDQTESEAKAIVTVVGDEARTIVITYLDQADEIVALCDDLGVSGVQLHGEINRDTLEKIREQRRELFVIKSLVVDKKNLAELISTVDDLHPWVDAFLTDTYDPATGRSGATGIAHDWRTSRQLVEASPKPVILAGGLTADNVLAAIQDVRPAGVDAHTGLEGPDGRKDVVCVQRFVSQANEAFRHLR